MAGTVIPREFEGSVCEIKTADNTFITTGKIASIASDKIKISVKSKQLRSLPFGYRIKLNIFNSKHGMRVIEGKLFTSGLGSVTLTDIFSLIEKERRKYFRVDMNMPSNVVFDNSLTGRPATAEIIIKNMSLNGVKFFSRQYFDMGAVIIFDLEINRRKSVEMICTIIRRGAEGSNGYMGYIGKLANKSENEDAIISFLLHKQGEMLNHSK